MLNNPYEAPQELATGGYITKELHSVTVHFDDIHYSLSSGQLNGWLSPHTGRAQPTINISNRNRKRFTRWLGSQLFSTRVRANRYAQSILVQRFLRLLQ